MEYRETITEIDKAVKLYRHGLFSIPEAINRIESAINLFMVYHPALSLDERIQKEGRLYRHGLVRLSEAVKAVIRS